MDDKKCELYFKKKRETMLTSANHLSRGELGQEDDIIVA
jgi:hypothetical protein